MRVSLSFAVPDKVSVTIGIFYFIASNDFDTYPIKVIIIAYSEKISYFFH